MFFGSADQRGVRGRRHYARVDGAAERGDDLHGRMVKAFLGGVRSALDGDEHYWTSAYVDQHVDLCNRIERLPPQGGFLVVMLCCLGAKLAIATAVATVEAIYQPPA
jgi:hypothetical protein